jgi:hypothetical protein
VTSFPPIDTVIRSTWPGWAWRKASAASICVWPSYGAAPTPSATLGQPTSLSTEVVVAPLQAKLASSSGCCCAPASSTSW